MTDHALSVLPSATATVAVGCDVQDVPAVAASITRFGERYLDRVLHPDELAHTSGFSAEHLAAHVSGRFAAKEAVFKLLHAEATDAVPWPDIEIGSDRAGAPAVCLHGNAAELARRADLADLSVTISHAGGFAFAVATALISHP